MQIVDDDQYKALSFVAVANRGGNRPTEVQLSEWMAAPRQKPAQAGQIIKPGRPAVYKTTAGPTLQTGVEAFLKNTEAMRSYVSGIESMRRTMQSAVTNYYSPMYQMLSSISDAAGGLVNRELVEPAIPAEYGPDVPAEAFVAHLVRLQWLESDERGGLGVTPLGRALLRSATFNDDDSELLDVVVLDANNELAYPIFVKKLAEAGESLLIDPYLRLEQLWAVKAYTTVSRVLISARVKQEDRVAMAVLVNAGGTNALEIRVADPGVLHDRLIVSDDQVLTIGTSINTIGRQHPTVLTPLPDVAADAFRQHAEKWWDEAEVLAAYPPFDDEDAGEDS